MVSYTLGFQARECEWGRGAAHLMIRTSSSGATKSHRTVPSCTEAGVEVEMYSILVPSCANQLNEREAAARAVARAVAVAAIG